MTDAHDITEGLDLLGDFLDAKGYTEEAGLCTRAMDEINRLRAENARLREALKPFADAARNRAIAKSDDAISIHKDLLLEACLAAFAALGER